jgi:epoxyqueuosine reductase
MTEQTVHLDPHQLAAQIKQRARSLGFDLVGITSASPSQYRDYYHQWLDDGQHGTMEYLAKRFDERTDPAVYLPGARSVICVAMNYHVPVNDAGAGGQNRDGQNGDVALLKRATSPLVGRISQYALGDDYHDLIKPRLHQLADFIRSLAPDAETRACVDTAPVMEKELAARAGIGWMGKNTCIINPHIGSWLFLGEVITTLDLPTDEPAIDRCGTCRRCIDACPTGAITDAYKLNARKCISYLTIEHRSDIDPALQSQIGEWLYGCDICQDVCPWNGKAPFSNESGFQPRFESARLDLNEVQQWQPSDYSARLKGSAMKRVKLPVLQRNARIVIQNLSLKDTPGTK